MRKALFYGCHMVVIFVELLLCFNSVYAFAVKFRVKEGDKDHDEYHVQ